MHGLVNRGLQSYLAENHGVEFWENLTQSLGLESRFEALLNYDDQVTEVLLFGAAAALKRPKKEILEDFGIYLVTASATHSLRRLLRFGGVDFPDFLASLNDLPGRVRLAMPDLQLPPLDVRNVTDTEYELHCGPQMLGLSYVLMGVLGALADDYGALVQLEHKSRSQHGDILSIRVFDTKFSDGRKFSLVEKTA